MTTELNSYAEKARDIFENHVKDSAEAKTHESAVVVIFPKIGRFIIADTPSEAIEKRVKFMEQYVGVDIGPSFTFNLLGTTKTAQ